MTSHVTAPQQSPCPRPARRQAAPPTRAPGQWRCPRSQFCLCPCAVGPKNSTNPQRGSHTAWPQGHRHPPTPCLSREERPGSTGLSVAERTPAGHTPLFAHGHGAQGDGRASTTATCVSPDVQASPAEGLQEHPSLAVTAGSLCWAGLGKALQSAGGRAEHKCPQGHYGAAQEMATTPRTWRQGHGADPFSLKASFPGARGPPPPGEGESTLGSGKPACCERPEASGPQPAPPSPTGPHCPGASRSGQAHAAVSSTAATQRRAGPVPLPDHRI